MKTAEKAPSLREQKKQAKLAAIEEAARSLFRSQGYAGTTTREIAERARIGVGTLFVYFPEKTDLLFYVFSQELERVASRALDSIPEELELVDALLHVFRQIFAFYDEDHELSRTFLKEYQFGTGRVRDDFNEVTFGIVARMGALVRDARARGASLRPLDDFQAGYQFFALYAFALQLWLGRAMPDRETALLQLRLSLDLAVDGMRA
ncbi:MAG: TetR/AcrR family transcriptional regulator [Polyangiaceae bacterium]|nr:TetR/AcrR family transcriptional regulator [Myxococcales bacterium]MCB9585624.1 TetR/AcrR family transcriptional regulator [Polyangiaceae bacterium]MCB9606361.1 TetR/AcrR family transcriptional regulator [Polyangiaceae bacterium]